MTEQEPSAAAPETQSETTIPETGELRIPLWIKLMWLGGMIWVAWYIIFGMQSTPDTWA